MEEKRRILALGGSNSSTSINKQLAHWVASQLPFEAELIDLNDYALPLFGVDLEREEGIPQKAKDFKSLIENADGIVLSLAEHNGGMAVALKNVVDWISRLEGKIWGNTPMLVMATSPGKRGGQTVLEAAKRTLPYQGAELSGAFSLPSFRQNFDASIGITDAQLAEALQHEIQRFVDAVRVASKSMA